MGGGGSSICTAPSGPTGGSTFGGPYGATVCRGLLSGGVVDLSEDRTLIYFYKDWPVP